jgi:hypothetical protein
MICCRRKLKLLVIHVGRASSFQQLKTFERNENVCATIEQAKSLFKYYMLDAALKRPLILLETSHHDPWEAQKMPSGSLPFLAL